MSEEERIGRASGAIRKGVVCARGNVAQREVGCGCDEHRTVCTGESVPGPVEASSRRSACCRWHVPAATAPSVRWDVGAMHMVGVLCAQ